MTEKITHKAHYPSGVSIIEVISDNSTAEYKFLGFRVGLAWPTSINQGGYFCIIGQETRTLLTGEHPLFVIHEEKALTITSLFEKMLDQMGIFDCTEVFTDFSPKYNTFINQLDIFRRTKRPTQKLTVQPAPFASSFTHGDELIRRWIKELKGIGFLKESIVKTELKEIRKPDLTDGAEQEFYAINGLRYVLGAYETSKIPDRSSRVTQRILPAGAWT